MATALEPVAATSFEGAIVAKRFDVWVAKVLRYDSGGSLSVVVEEKYFFSAGWAVGICNSRPPVQGFSLAAG